MRSDVFAGGKFLCKVEFQPTLLREERRDEALVHPQGIRFQPTLLREERRNLNSYLVTLTKFQPTLLREERLLETSL